MSAGEPLMKPIRASAAFQPVGSPASVTARDGIRTSNIGVLFEVDWLLWLEDNAHFLPLQRHGLGAYGHSEQKTLI